MSCPECGAESSRVITTRAVINIKGSRCRWRQCNSCGHKFYTLQSPEVVVSQYDVQWLDRSNLRINPAALRRSRGPAD